MHNEGLKTEPYKIIACISGEDKDVANHVSPFSILTVGGSIHLTSKVIPWTDLPLYVGMKFTDYGKQLLSTVCSESK